MTAAWWPRSAAASSGQSAGIAQVNQAVTQMDQGTAKRQPWWKEAWPQSSPLSQRSLALSRVVGSSALLERKAGAACSAAHPAEPYQAVIVQEMVAKHVEVVFEELGFQCGNFGPQGIPSACRASSSWPAPRAGALPRSK